MKHNVSILFGLLMAVPGLVQAQAQGLPAGPPTVAGASSPTSPGLPISTVRVTQVAVDLPAVDLWVAVKNSAGDTIASVPPEAFKVAIGDAPLEIRKVDPPPTNDPIAWILMVDCSGTMAGAPFTSATAASKKLIEGMAAKDWMAIVRFGSDVRVVQDFTQGKEALTKALDSLQPTDSSTKLFQALRQSLDMLRRVGPGFPTRRGILVVTDGKDEGSGLTIDDLLGPSREFDVPVLAVGYSRQRSWSFDALNRLASISGGLFLQGPKPSTIPEVFATLVSQYRDVYKLRAEWLSGKADGTRRQVQVSVASGSTVLPASRSAVMLSTREPPPPEPTPEPIPDSGADAGVTPPDEPDLLVPILGGLGLLILLGALAVVWWIRRRSPSPEPGPDDEPAPSPLPGDVGPSGHEPAGSGGMRTGGRVVLARIRLVAVQGSGRLEPPGPEFGIPPEGLVIGRSGDICIVGDDEVSARHCRLVWKSPYGFIEDLGARNGLFRNGGAVKGLERLEDGDVLLLGRTRIRVHLPEHKP